MASRKRKQPAARRPAGKRAPVRRPVDFDDEESVLAEMAQALNIDPNDLEIEENQGLSGFGAGTVYTVRIAHGGSKEWSVVENYDQQRALALEIVKQDLEEEPGNFNRDFIEQHINTERLARDLHTDVWNEKYDYYSEIGDDRFWREAERLGMDIPEEDEDGNLPEPDSDDYDKAADIAAKEALKDPIAYLEEIYGDEATLKAIEIAGIDVNAAAEDAVDTDGEAHFLSRYDGNDYHTRNGLVYWRDN